MKRRLPLLVVLVTAAIGMALKFFSFAPSTAATDLDTMVQTSYLFAFLFGPINLLRRG